MEDEDRNELEWEEHFDCQFPDDRDETSMNFKILEMAAKWNAQQHDNEYSNDDSDDDASDNS
jgi:hypothetical protein